MTGSGTFDPPGIGCWLTGSEPYCSLFSILLVCHHREPWQPCFWGRQTQFAPLFHADDGLLGLHYLVVHSLHVTFDSLQLLSLVIQNRIATTVFAPVLWLSSQRVIILLVLSKDSSVMLLTLSWRDSNSESGGAFFNHSVGCHLGRDISDVTQRHT